MQLIDGYGRIINYLRLSVGDHCNYHCRYCRNEDDKTHSQRLELLSYAEIARLVNIFAKLGIIKVRLSGGEPLLRKDLVQLVKLIKKNERISDIALSTNAHLLKNYAEDLYQAGVNRVNISIDSLQEKRFRDITRGGDLAKVLKGIDAAIRTGMTPIKINMVVMEGVNDDEIEAMLDYAIAKKIDIRFIETMPIGTAGISTLSKRYRYEDIKARIDAHLPTRLEALSRNSSAGPASNFFIKDSQSQVGIIAALSKNFCKDCNRIRLSAKGYLLLCLGQEHGLSLKQMLRNNCNDAQISTAIIAAVTDKKPKQHYFNEDIFHIATRNMVEVGG